MYHSARRAHASSGAAGRGGQSLPRHPLLQCIHIFTIHPSSSIYYILLQYIILHIITYYYTYKYILLQCIHEFTIYPLSQCIPHLLLRQCLHYISSLVRRGGIRWGARCAFMCDDCSSECLSSAHLTRVFIELEGLCYMYMYVYIYIYMVYVFMYMYFIMYACTYVIYMYIYIYTYIHKVVYVCHMYTYD